MHRDIPWSGTVCRRGQELEQSNWGADAVTAAVLRTVAANSAGTAAAVAD